MLAPISWLKEYVEIKLPLKTLMWKLTEAGLTCESYKKTGDDIILDIEVTANRPDWMSIVGIAREIAAIQGTKLKLKEPEDLLKLTKTLLIKLNADYKLFDRWTGVIISGVTIKPSPQWLQYRLMAIDQRPINNIIDITNYVMFELGIPMHAFDYDEIRGAEMTVQLSKGGEHFTSVDDLSYKLPKDAIIINDTERLIDLAGIKGGLNSGIKSATKNIFLHLTLDNPVLIRRTSQNLGLRSEASAIYERVPDKGGTVRSLKRAANLVLELAGGDIASEIIDLKKEAFEPWNINLRFEKLEKVLGIKIPEKEVYQILKKLNLDPKKSKNHITCLIPTYRGDIKIEEDLIEEIARIYGYNKFPKTLPEGNVANYKVPYFFDDKIHLKLKEILVANGFTEVMTLSLISEELIRNCGLKAESHIRIENPVSNEYKYMRSSLIPSLLAGLKLNQENPIRIFELDKVFIGTPQKHQEIYRLSGVTRGIEFRELKGVIDFVIEKLNIPNIKVEFESPLSFWHPTKSATIMTGEKVLGYFGEISPEVNNNLSLKENVFAFELDVKTIGILGKKIIFKPVPEYPAQIEDITLEFPAKTKIGEAIISIKSVSQLINNVELTDIYKDSYTFRVWYQHPTKTLTDKEVEEIRNKILQIIKTKYGGILKI